MGHVSTGFIRDGFDYVLKRTADEAGSSQDEEVFAAIRLQRNKERRFGVSLSWVRGEPDQKEHVKSAEHIFQIQDHWHQRSQATPQIHDDILIRNKREAEFARQRE